MPFRYLMSKSSKALQTLSSATESLILTWKDIATLFGLQTDIYKNPLHKPLLKPVTAVLIGAGHRGNIYADYALLHPEELVIAGVGEINAVRNGKLARKHRIPA